MTVKILIACNHCARSISEEEACSEKKWLILKALHGRVSQTNRYPNSTVTPYHFCSAQCLLSWLKPYVQAPEACTSEPTP